MARIVKPEHKHHSVRLRSDGNRGEMLLIGKGRGAYVWAGRDGAVTTYSGRVALRKFAQAILAAVGDV